MPPESSVWGEELRWLRRIDSKPEQSIEINRINALDQKMFGLLRLNYGPKPKMLKNHGKWPAVLI
jgi:hypothetical protein